MKRQTLSNNSKVRYPLIYNAVFFHLNLCSVFQMFTSQSNVYIHARMLNYFIQCSFFLYFQTDAVQKKNGETKKMYRKTNSCLLNYVTNEYA